MKTRLIPLMGLCAALASSPAAQAGPGHDHGEATPTASAAKSLPRFVASSELFELVGVLNGKHLSLYLDHADTNAPVQNARIELEWAGSALALVPHGPGEFEATLAHVPADGGISITATVRSDKASDLLAADLDLHGQAGHDATPHLSAQPLWKQAGGWATGLVLVMLAGWVMLRRRQGSTGVRTAPSMGDAA